MSTTIPISKCKQCFHFEPFLFMHFWLTFEKGPSKKVNNWKLKKILDVRKFTIFWDGRVNKINIDLDIDIDDSGHYQYRYRIDLKIRLSLTPAKFGTIQSTVRIKLRKSRSFSIFEVRFHVKK